MQKNIGTIDKTVRIVVGLALIALAVMGVGTPWTWLGVLPLATGLVGSCPAYTLLKTDTLPKD
ncbi:MAG TPA: DUF2892 domain-containing protein [Azoarcus sp.]|nr:DUF2892 domain-containing protein [Azoarcus sp.]